MPKRSECPKCHRPSWAKVACHECRRSEPLRKPPQRYQRRTAHALTCRRCGAQFTTGKNGTQQVYCSYECKRARVQRRVNAKRRISVAARGSKGKQPIVVDSRGTAARRKREDNPNRPRSVRVFLPDCVICGTCFATPYTVVTCSAQCAAKKRSADRRLSQDKRRARKRDAFVANVYRRHVYERDNWTCRICGRRVDKTKTVPHPNAPTLDHIIPLALGGSHEPSNVQTAHFLCNARKSHVGSGDQLRLIG